MSWVAEAGDAILSERLSKVHPTDWPTSLKFKLRNNLKLPSSLLIYSHQCSVGDTVVNSAMK